VLCIITFESELNVYQENGRNEMAARGMEQFVRTFANPISESTPHIYLSALSFAPNDLFVSQHYGGQYPMRLQVSSSGMETGPSEGHTKTVTSVAISGDGRCIVSGSEDTTILVWDANTGRVIVGPFKGHTDKITSVSFSSDGRRIVSGSEDTTIRVWNADTGEVTAGPFKRHTNTVTSVAFSPDGHRIVSGSWDDTIIVWNLDTGELTAGLFEGHTDWVTSVAFSPDGKHIISGFWDGSILVWDAETGMATAGPFEGHSDWITCVALSLHGRCIVSGFNNRTIRMRDGETGEVIAGPFEGHTRWITSVAFSADGNRIISGSEDKTIRVWDLKTDVKSVCVFIPPYIVLFKGPTNINGLSQSLPFTPSSRMDENGWVIGPNSELLFWVPPDFRPGLYRPNNPIIIGNCIKTTLDFSSFVHGKLWTNCRGSFLPQVQDLCSCNIQPKLEQNGFAPS
jgi:WD40 repeat protein